MFPIWKKICIFVVLLALAANVSAQTNFNEIEGEVSKALLKKDLRQAIKEADAASANNLHSLLRRLSLYRRAAHGEKVASTVRQIITGSFDTEKNPYAISDNVLNALKDPLFKDTQTLQFYLQFTFSYDIYGKFIELCLQKRESCDIGGFDKWLEQKASENAESEATQNNPYAENNHWTWVSRRINWREQFGLDNREILSQFAENVRKNPADLDVALRYLGFFKSAHDISWLAESFASEQSFDYYELGERLSSEAWHRQMPEDERAQIYRIAVRLLQKSLTLPFGETDTSQMYSRKFRYASVPVNIKNPEKQLRFWTKKELAEVYKKMGRPQDAQPIIEELMSIDTSDILSYKPSQLAGQVQAGSGARAVESKILVEQATRQNSYGYWQERITYYEGRKEPERIFDSYLQSFASVPFVISDKRSRGDRLFYINRFADFAEDEFERYVDDDPKDLNEGEKLKQSLWREAEKFLRSEFEKTKSNIRYSYKLADIINDAGFKKLSSEIVGQNSELLISAAQADLLNGSDGLLYHFFNGDNISQAKKDVLFEQLLKIAEKKDFKNAWVLCDALNNFSQPAYPARIIPILEKNLKITENRSNWVQTSDDDYYDFKDLKDRYLDVLFNTYLFANDWKSAEKLVMEKDSSRYYSSFDRLVLTAAKNGAFNDAVRYWKLKANLDRRNLENLASLKGYPTIAKSLRQFYKQMKIDEPYSPIPNIALQYLK